MLSVTSSVLLASPKSVSQTRSSRSRIRFDGFTSRWTISRWWAWAKASTACRAPLRHFFQGEGPAALLEDLIEAASFNELHRVVVDAVMAPDGKYRHDVRVVQIGNGRRFSLESFERRRI